MHLLRYDNVGEFSLTQDLLGNDVPKYAILSHTWGSDAEEVSFSDLVNGTGKGKSGYDKIKFCGEQARRDGLQFFWVDTCCIDKSNNTELSEAINSMFRWYCNAARCYVYLADVSRPLVDVNGKLENWQWEAAFRKSRWFTRGWTLQELIAPASVGFFSKEGEWLGDKQSLGRWISEITGIPSRALKRDHLYSFTVAERLLWQQHRQTKRDEDKAYSLLGLCGVHMPLIYGEGRKNAFKRLHEEIQKTSKAARKLLNRIGTQHEDFSVAFSFPSALDIEHFVAREEELETMHRALSGNGSRRAVVLHGLGGMGKTQLTIAYAKRHRDSYSAIFWVNANDDDAAKQSFTSIARQVLREHPLADRLGRTNEKDASEVVDAVKAWLSLRGNTRWLMIYDNYDMPKLPNSTDAAAVDIRCYLPESYQGSVIITTRSSRVDLGHAIKITKLEDVKDGVKILSNMARRAELSNDLDAVRLAKELDGLPLALATAGAYLRQVAISCSDYLRLYKASWSKLQQTSPGLTSYEDRTLYSTWQISFDRVRQQNELSAMLLRLWAYFDNRDLWFELLRHRDAKDPLWLQELTEDELTFYAAIRVLTDHGFVDAEMSSQDQIESKGYSMHGCVHSWTIHVLNHTWDYNMAKLSLKCVASHIPEKMTAKWWLTERRLLQHAVRCTDMLLRSSIIDDDMAWSCHNLGNLYADQRKLREAEEMYQRALQGKEKALGAEHTSTLDTVNNLGLLYADQRKLRKAEEMYQRALQGKEKALGTEHTSTLDTVNNLGLLYANQGKLREAEEMYQRALQGKEKALGTEHTSTLNTVNNLGNLYADQGKLLEAEEMYQRTLQGYEKALGAEHTSTLNTVLNLGLLYANQGKLREAEEMYQRALQGYEKTLGTEHTSTLDTVNNLGLLYANQGKLCEVEEMYQRVLQGYEKVFGTEHISTLDTVNNLGSLYANQGKLREAEEMYRRALQGKEKALGTEHTSTLNTVNNLGNLYADQDKLRKAEEMYQRALEGYEKALGSDFVLSYVPALNTAYNMGLLFAQQGNLYEARVMYMRALAGYRNVFGIDHQNCQNVEDQLRALQISSGGIILSDNT